MEVTSPGNDRVASVFIQTAVEFDGELYATIDADGLILDTPDVPPTPVPGFDDTQSQTRLARPIVLTPIPEPATLALIAFAVIWLAVLGHRRRPRWTFKTRHRPLLRLALNFRPLAYWTDFCVQESPRIFDHTMSIEYTR